jgi:hypothetical protein
MISNELHSFFESLPVNREVSKKGFKKYPRVYYIGKGKTGSSSLMRGIDENVAHWHSTWYYEYAHGITSLTERNLTIYDFLEWIDLNIHPIQVIECYRDPIAQYISALHQWESDIPFDKLAKMLDVRYPEITFQKEIEKPDSPLGVLYLKTEDSAKWSTVLAEHNINYTYNTNLVNIKEHYIENIKKVTAHKVFSQRKLDYIYSSDKVVQLYSPEEIENFKLKWLWKEEIY